MLKTLVLRSTRYHIFILRYILAGESVRTRFILLDSNNEFHSYDTLKRSWNEVMTTPFWFDNGSAMTSHNEGILVAGANSTTDGMHISALNFTTLEDIPLPDLHFCVR